MKRRLTLATLASAMVAASAAYAGTAGYYVTGMGGASFLPDLHYRPINSNVADTGFTNENFDDGYAYGGAVGYDTGNGWRMEVQSIYQKSDLEGLGTTPMSGHLTTTSLMLNGTYDLASINQFTPFVGAGLGFQNVGGQINGMGGHQWRPAYQVEAGLRTDIAPHTSLFGEYRFSQSESARLYDRDNPALSAQQHFANHALLAGITYKIPAAQ